ncbi:TPA: hypothetical protein ACNIJT_000338 [Enterobacter hormaechei]
MSTMTKERAAQIAAGGGFNFDEIAVLARIALASLEAESVAEVCEGFALRYIGHGPAPKSWVHIGDRLYTAPPAPMLPEEMPKGLAGQIVSLLAHNIGDKLLAQKIWNACRAAMLQGAEQTNYRAIVERIAEIIHGKVTDIDLLTVTVKSMKDKLQK